MVGKRSRPYTVDDVEFVYNNYAKMTASEIASKLGISKFQVSKIVGELRKHMELPKKTIQRPNPILLFLEKHGVQPKTSTTKESKTGKAKK